VLTQLGGTLKSRSVGTRNAERLVGDVLEACQDFMIESKELLDVFKAAGCDSESHYRKA
jgi:hypothetical protein